MTRPSVRRRLDRVEVVEGPPAVTPPPLSPLPPADDGGDLARELAAAFGHLVEQYRRYYGLSPQEAAARAGQDHPDDDERSLTCPPDEVSWFALDGIAQRDPEAARRRWEEVKEAARGELRSGHRSARALEGYDGSCWQRAQFLAVRAELTEAWRPRDGQEQQLVDQLAQRLDDVEARLGPEARSEEYQP